MLEIKTINNVTKYFKNDIEISKEDFLKEKRNNFIYIYKDKALKKHKKDELIPEGWSEITLEDWDLMKGTWSIPVRTQQEIDSRKEIREILLWFRENDYIELQALRGTVDRGSQKYTDYVAEYNIKLARYKVLTGK